MFKRIALGLLVSLVTSLSSVNAQEVKEYSVFIESQDLNFTSYTAMLNHSPDVPTSSVDVKVGVVEFHNPAFSYHHFTTNPNVLIIGAGTTDKFHIAVKLDKCEEVRVISLSDTHHSICDISFTIKPMVDK